MLDANALKGFRPLVATPCYGGMLCLNYALSVLRLQWASVEAGINRHFQLAGYLVTRCRNDCVTFFLANPQFTHLFFIDSDIGFAPEAAFRLLVLSDHDITAGDYPLKRDDWPRGCRKAPRGRGSRRFTPVILSIPESRERTASNSHRRATGSCRCARRRPDSCCIKRGVFDRLIAAYPELQYVPDWPKGTYPEGGVHYRFFDVMVDPETRRYLSEDYGFCRLWEEDRRRSLCRLRIPTSTKAERLYTGDFGATLRSALPSAVGAPESQRMRIIGLENLKPKP